MESKHTPEPWRVDFSGVTDSVRNNCGMPIAYLNSYVAGAQDNARRIVACVNACAGSTTDDLIKIATDGGWNKVSERWSMELHAAIDNADSFADEIARLEQQRDELLAAAVIGARWMRFWIDDDLCDCDGEHHCGRTERRKELTVMEASIAKARGDV